MNTNLGKVYLIPTVLHEDEIALKTIPQYISDAIKDCNIFFVENERTARRFFKKIWKEILIDNYEWFTIHKAEENVTEKFISYLKDEKNVGIISEAGCPGIADPGQILVESAQQIDATVKPLVGPNSILLALMASGMNGQNFQFVGYLTIESSARKKMLRDLEEESYKKKCTQIFIETPYRNNQLINDIFSVCKNETKLCIAVNLTSSKEFIKTKTISEWKKNIPELHKQTTIFLMYAK